MMRTWFFILIVFLAGNVLAVEGVSPGSYEVDFGLGLDRDFVFDFVLNGEDELRVMGDFVDYVELDKERISGSESVVASLSLPEDILIDSLIDWDYGVNNIWILAGDVAAIIKVEVPYPNEYILLEVKAPNMDLGDDVEIEVGALNLGKDDVFVESSVELYRKGGSNSRELVDEFDLGGRMVNVSKKEVFGVSLDTNNYSSGDYLAVARAEYGESVSSMENVFRLGDFKARVLNYSEEFYGGKINKLEVWVESLYNNNMKDVYVGVCIVESGKCFDSILVDFDKWEKRKMLVYFDARDIESNVDVEISLYYGDEVESDVVKLWFLEGFDWFALFWVLGVLVLIGFVLWRLRRMFSKSLGNVFGSKK